MYYGFVYTFIKCRIHATLNVFQETARTLKNVIRGVDKSNLFIMVDSDLEIAKALAFCKIYKLCYTSHVMSPDSNKQDLYEAFYSILETNLNTFSSDLEKRTQTRNVHATRTRFSY